MKRLATTRYFRSSSTRRLMVGRRIKRGREKANYTQLQLAEELGMSTQALSAIENGVYLPTKRLVRIAELLEVTINYLLFGKNGRPAEFRGELRDYIVGVSE